MYQNMGVAMEKTCERCGCLFSRARKLSNSQWENRRYCSKSCGAKQITISDQEIISMYSEKMMSSYEIANLVGISSVHVLRIIKKNSVDVRSMSESKILSHSKPEVRRKISESRSGAKMSESAKKKLKDRVGKKNANWCGGITISKAGYIQFTDSEANGVNAGEYLHRVIAKWLYCRDIADDEHVHHIDGNKLNNNPDNLCILSASEHAQLHMRGIE